MILYKSPAKTYIREMDSVSIITLFMKDVDPDTTPYMRAASSPGMMFLIVGTSPLLFRLSILKTVK